MGYNKKFYKITLQNIYFATFIIIFFRLHFICDKFVDSSNYKQLQKVHKRAIVDFIYYNHYIEDALIHY